MPEFKQRQQGRQGQTKGQEAKVCVTCSHSVRVPTATITQDYREAVQNYRLLWKKHDAKYRKLSYGYRGSLKSQLSSICICQDCLACG